VENGDWPVLLISNVKSKEKALLVTEEGFFIEPLLGLD
jgi:hypothetical protein